MRNSMRTWVWPLPDGRFWDWVFAQFKFLKDHGRLPSKAMRFNDVICRQKTAPGFPRRDHVRTTDKEFAKSYIAERIGREYCVPTIAILRSESEIRTFEFPDSCVIKPTHSSGHVIIRRGGEPIDIEAVIGWLEDDFYRRSREPQYRHLDRKIIVEPLAFGNANVEDFRVFCFQGNARMIMWDPSRELDESRLFDRHWTALDTTLGCPASPRDRARPEALENMLQLAETLARDFDFVRVDFYVHDGSILVGEITHTHGNASERFHPPEGEQTVSTLLFNPS